MTGKGAKGLITAGKTSSKTEDKGKDKKKPVSRSSRAGLQVSSLNPSPSDHFLLFLSFPLLSTPLLQSSKLIGYIDPARKRLKGLLVD